MRPGARCGLVVLLLVGVAEALVSPAVSALGLRRSSSSRHVTAFRMALPAKPQQGEVVITYCTKVRRRLPPQLPSRARGAVAPV